jgi:hypothetical protein
MLLNIYITAAFYINTLFLIYECMSLLRILEKFDFIEYNNILTINVIFINIVTQ